MTVLHQRLWNNIQWCEGQVGK